jgi:rhodanese-related sulfurtransferase/glyoxylase-like metal-dependent hydrolase (beta-lactamase superfamily II)
VSATPDRPARDVTVEHLATALEAGATLIDVRETGEYVGGHVPGARLLPMGQLPARVHELDRDRPVYLICASGNRSAAMTDFLTHAGYRAHNVEGGTTAWQHSGRPVVAGHPEISVIPIETPSLGDRSYLAHDGRVALVVDPQRDLDRVETLLEEHQLELLVVAESHLHNDYITGGHALARKTGADYLVNAADEVSFERTPVRDGETVEVGDRMRLTAIATPGHTFTHLSYVLSDAASGEQVAVFSGGSLLFGATGRPDLLGEEHTDELVRLQHHSAHRLAESLPDAVEVFPTHGFGSFCSATQSEATSSTIGREKASNPVLTQDEETYVKELLDGLGAWPAYYVHMASANASGPSEADLSAPAAADADELRERIESGEWVVDLRNRTAFAAGHAPGTLNFGLDGAFATYLGWLITWGTPVTLLGETAADVAEAQRELVRIGIDRPAAAATGGPRDWTTDELAGFHIGTFADLELVRRHRPVVVLDVRRADEYESMAIAGAVNIPIHELPRRLADVPAGEVWVHCASGYRASVAASFLDAAGRTLVAIDDSFENAEKVGLHLVGADVSGSAA